MRKNRSKTCSGAESNYLSRVSEHLSVHALSNRTTSIYDKIGNGLSQCRQANITVILANEALNTVEVIARC